MDNANANRPQLMMGNGPAMRGPGMAAPPKGTPHLQLAWRHKFVILTFVLLGVVAGAIRVVFETPLYRATTTVELVGFNQSFLGMKDVDPQAGTDTSGSVASMATQVMVLTSRSLMERVLERMNLEMTPVTQTPNTFFTSLRNRLPFFQREPLVQSREALTVAASTVSAKAVGATRLIEIECQSTSPDVAANFVNTLAAEHQAQTLSERANVTQKTSQWMDSQLEEAKARLQQASEKLQDFVKKSGMDFFPDMAPLADSKMHSLQADVAAIQADRIAKQSRWELVKSTPIDSLPDVMNDAGMQGLKAQIQTLQIQKAQMLATLTPEHYKVKKIQAQIDEATESLQKEKTAFLKRTQSDYEEALRREKLLTGAYNSQTHSVSAQADKASQYAMLKRDVDTEQQLYNLLLQQSSQAALIALAPSSSIRVVDAAVPNPAPSSPNPAKEIPLATMMGGALGYGLLWLRETMRQKKRTELFDTPGHTLTILGVPELGVIPSLPSSSPRKFLPLPSPFARGIQEKSDTAGWTLGTEESSLLSESFRQTLISLLRTRPKDHNPLYVITSAGPAEGKTTLCANLARAMAEVGQRVLLLDADLRRPHVHNLFGTREHKGLSDILASGAEVAKLDLESFVQSTEVNNLSVITHGLTEVDNPALLFFSPRVGELAVRLKNRFDCILVDTAPALPFPDARLWGKYSDGVVLVVRAGVTTREGASAACDRFVQDNVAVVGTILNDWTPVSGSKLSYYHYGYAAANGKRK